MEKEGPKPTIKLENRTQVNCGKIGHRFVVSKGAGMRSKCLNCRITLKEYKQAQEEAKNASQEDLSELPPSLLEAWVALCEQHSNMGDQLLMFAAHLKDLDLALGNSKDA